MRKIILLVVFGIAVIILLPMMKNMTFANNKIVGTVLSSATNKK